MYHFFSLSEISLVENAVYTDPNDQSAWFYHRWLLSHITNPVKLIHAGFDRGCNLAWVVIHPYNSHVQIRGLGDEPWEFLNGKKFSNVFVSFFSFYFTFEALKTMRVQVKLLVKCKSA